MDFKTLFSPPNLFSGYSSPGSKKSAGEAEELYDTSDRLFRPKGGQLEIPHTQTHMINSHSYGSVSDMHRLDWHSSRPKPDYQAALGLATLEHVDMLHSDFPSTNQQSPPDHRQSQVTSQPVDLADRVKGMYRLLALISESGSNGYVDKVVIAQDSLQRFVNAMSPGAYTSVTKVDFKTLDRLMIKPLGVYGSKDEIVHLLRSIGAIDEDETHLFLAPTGVMGSLSSGLYIVRARTSDLVDERHYVIYWPEESTWNDSATSSACRNRVTFMRYLTKMCDQVVALLSPEQSASLVWNDQDGDTESVDTDIGDSDRLYTFEVAKTIEQEESAVARPGFQMDLKITSQHGVPLDCPVDPGVLAPRLLPGETSQGILTATYIPHRIRSEDFQQSFSRTSLKQLLTNNAFILSETLDEDNLQTLSDIAISKLFPELCNELGARKQEIRGIFRQELSNRQSVAFREISSKGVSLRNVLLGAVVKDVVALFPSIDSARLSSRASTHGKPDASEVTANSMTLSDVEQQICQKHVRDARFDTVLKRQAWFEARKLRLISVQNLLTEYPQLSLENRIELIATFLKGDFDHAQQILPKAARKSRFPGYSRDISFKEAMKILAARTPDRQFLLQMKDMEGCDEGTRSMIQEVQDFAQTTLASSIGTTVETMARAIQTKQQELGKQSVQDEVNNEESKALRDALVDFIQKVNARSAERGKSIVYLDHIKAKWNSRAKWGSYARWGSSAGWSSYDDEYTVTGRKVSLQRPMLAFWIHPMDLTSDDKHSMQLDTKHIPSPTVNDRLSSSFRLPVGVDIAFYRILENERLLLVLVDRDNIYIYVDRFPAMDTAVRGRPIKRLNHEKLGEDVLFAFDETKRVLVVCASVKLQLHVFVFDETFKILQGHGSAIDLVPWYGQPGISILHAAFVSGKEEVVLVDSSAQARIFSFITLQFRPAFLQLPSLPNAIFSSPDGSCLVISHNQDSPPSLTAYHWETFGSTQGIPLDAPDFPLQNAVLTSMVSRGCVFLVGLDKNTGYVQSIAIDITKKVTEFMFKEKGNTGTSDNGERQTLHNILLDCHAEVWTRFPVVPAVKRCAVTSLSERRQRRLAFVSEQHAQPFDSYFSDLIQTFERSTRKPTGDELRRIKVSATDFGAFGDEIILNPEWNVSRYRVGEWLVDLLCLIPIHIAVCRENRFVPLANGVLSAELERSLLGASVNTIVDNLSFGWYESIFQSYLATKPVKVVTSMGQQSVGKSFSLNHFLDTSFAGSAMRTTEGVWMSVTPTEDALIVALDFEGVDSVERSLQEDTLLVLFNTAISNMVLFRNNFAFSRDISGLFQSFQSGASVLDPAANPTLFQSTLVIIIKDVVEPDKKEVTREFSLKFQKIVQQEQDANFISRLHGGKLDIIPWPVIASKEFYKVFTTLKKRLDLQKISHPTAGEFLHTIKTLMAKLKANDWGALSQTMIEHRARTLSTFLPIALATGYSEIEPSLEPLKNFDTDVIVERDDTASRFAFSQNEQISSEDIEKHLSILRESWNQITPRQSIPDSDWMQRLGEYISELIDLRVGHVRLWLSSNLERFQASHATIEDLRRRFDSMVIEMRANVQFCSAQCASCHLLCVQGRLHEGDHSCQTTHKCGRNCRFCTDNLKPCGTPAGHPGEHICVVNAHLCGEPCNLSGKRGCLEDCTKGAGHAEDEHMCSALLHMCGEPCSLKGMRLPGRKTYSCPESCTIPSDQEHVIHSCDARLCPMTCDLCKRLCVQPHFHGLTPGTHHLCGEAHSCSALCSAPGICQIETAPQSIEATFTGEHETFQYTKYSQVSKRLQCVKAIEPGQSSHTGSHVHSKEDQPFHFCETRCENCGYFCTLPLGHTQQEHETSHGSMKQTRWAIDGADQSAVELGGRKFSSNDEGAPMMCNLVCSSMGRHVHIDYCRVEDNTPCEGAEIQHIKSRMTPYPDRTKDAITHSLYWRRMGFKDPYTRDEQTNFAKCDAMCPDPGHSTTAATAGQPSYCVLPMFHPPKSVNDPVNGHCYVSNDGHMFECRNPAVTQQQQAFHVIFVIDRSSSMAERDRRPLANAPATDRIRLRANNRLGAVYSALYSFWSARHAAVIAGQTVGVRRDAYSVILFNSTIENVLVNDLENTPDRLLDTMLTRQASGGTDFTAALQASQNVMVENWNTERTPIMIFLSDGECDISDTVIQDLCRSAVELGKPLSFHAVSFGQDTSNSTLRRMAELALEIQSEAPHDPLRPAPMNIPSSFNTALDTVRLAETFLLIAESLRKPRGSLMR